MLLVTYLIQLAPSKRLSESSQGANDNVYITVSLQ